MVTITLELLPNAELKVASKSLKYTFTTLPRFWPWITIRLPGSAAFSDSPGQLRVVQENGAFNIYGDINGDGVTDLHIAVLGDAPLVGDFIL